MSNAGDKRHPITLQQKVKTGTNSLGEDTYGWQDVLQVWAAINPVSLRSMRGAKEMVRAGADTDMDIWEVTILPYPGLDSTWRFTHNVTGLIYDIQAVRPNNDNSEVTMLALQGASNG